MLPGLEEPIIEEVVVEKEKVEKKNEGEKIREGKKKELITLPQSFSEEELGEAIL